MHNVVSELRRCRRPLHHIPPHTSNRPDRRSPPWQFEVRLPSSYRATDAWTTGSPVKRPRKKTLSGARLTTRRPSKARPGVDSRSEVALTKSPLTAMERRATQAAGRAPPPRSMGVASSRWPESPGSTKARQPTDRHGANAGSDEEPMHSATPREIADFDGRSEAVR